MATELQPGAGTAVPRECTVCPPWVVACAHWDGRAVQLINEELIGGSLPLHRSSGKRFLLAGPGVLAPCHGRDGHLVFPDADNFRYLADSFPTAEAEFRRREAKLLGRAE